MIWLGLVLWHINHCRLFNAESSLDIYIEYIWFGLVGVYGISTIVGYLMPNPFIHIYQIHKIWFVGVLWHINHWRLFNAKSSFYIYIKYMILFGLVFWHINPSWLFNAESSLYISIKYIGRGWVEFYGISTIVGYLRPTPFHTFILNIYNLVVFYFVAYQPLWVI